ncbi:conserved hypothetical protein [Actinacidiphila cocklensis]|uniref:Uncharacterized protein n=1 Tax=Actinacidiphila cocklensis TaxID=887465 RepID=A0A9W4DXT1_9ACTN|nr:conserved hypothetical protein [Actinacidiphila cocklensis]
MILSASPGLSEVRLPKRPGHPTARPEAVSVICVRPTQQLTARYKPFMPRRPGRPLRRRPYRPQKQATSGRRCGRPTAKGAPCKLQSTEYGACRHHTTAADRSRVIEQKQKQWAAMRQHQDQLAKRTRWGMAAALVVVLAVIALQGWSRWRGSQADAACEAPQHSYQAARHRADLVRVPLVGDPILARLPNDSYVPEATDEGQIMAAYSERRQLFGTVAGVVLKHAGCFGSDVVAMAHNVLATPETITSVQMPSPPHCADNWPSTSIGKQGACSHHGGVVYSMFAILHFE